MSFLIENLSKMHMHHNSCSSFFGERAVDKQRKVHMKDSQYELSIEQTVAYETISPTIHYMLLHTSCMTIHRTQNILCGVRLK